MLRIHPSHLESVQRAAVPGDLVELMQEAMKLEHATIPVYLTGMMSLAPKTNSEIRTIMRSVVVEEMLHLSIACNIINALGGEPRIDDPGFVPAFPGPLPLGIGGITVGLEAFSQQVVHDTYMAIEEPEQPIDFPVRAEAAMVEAATFATIGQFYAAVAKRIEELVPGQMPGDPARQLTRRFPSDELFAICTGADAVKAIDIIVKQGEGTSKSPLDPEGDFAHYYRFAEIFHGRRLVPDQSNPDGYSYSGATIAFDPEHVYPIEANTKLEHIPQGTEARNAARTFTESYSRLLRALHVAFNGNPGHIDVAMGMMFDVQLAGQQLCAMPFPGRAGKNVGPTFEYSANPDA